MLPRPGERLGPYVVIDVLGRGGMGAVLRARHAATGAIHAVKLILPERAGSETSLARFRREAEILGSLPPHPGIVRVHASGVDAGRLWCAAELIEGRPLAGVIDETGPLDPREAARLAAAIGRALDHAHAHGVIHRDVKPENIIIAAGDRAPRLIDFGLARDLETTRLTRTGDVLGTPAFMAPEQADAGETPTTEAADVWGLGAVLYAMLTGEPPFGRGEAHALIVAVLLHDARPPSHRRSGIAPELDAICGKALEKEPGDRYGSAGALADDLERWRAGEPTEARPPGAIGRLWIRLRPRTRRLRRVTALAAIALAVAALAAVSLAVPTLLGPDPIAALEAIEARTDATGSISDEDAILARGLAADPAIADAGDRGGGPLRRRAELLAALHGAGTPRLDAAEVARLVRSEDAVNGPLLGRALRVLVAANDPTGVREVLYGVEPTARNEHLEDAAALDFLVARIVAGQLAPPLGPELDELLEGRSDEVAGALLLRHAETLYRGPNGEEVTDAVALDRALRSLREAILDRGVPSERSRLTVAVVDRCRTRFHAAGSEGSVDQTRAELDLLVRIEDAEDAREPSELLGHVAYRSNLLIGVIGRGRRERDETTERMLLLSAWLLTQRVDRIGSLRSKDFEALLGETESLFDDDLLARRGRAELARPARERNPAVLLAIASLRMPTSREAYTEERREGILPLIEGALETELRRAWLYTRAARHYVDHEDPFLWPRPFEVATRAVEIDEADAALDDRRRLPFAHEALARVVLRARGALIRPDDPDVTPPPVTLDDPRLDLGDAIARVRVAVALQSALDAWWPPREELDVRPWPRIRSAEEMAGRLSNEMARLIDLGPPDCCKASGEDGPLIDRIVEACAELPLEEDQPHAGYPLKGRALHLEAHGDHAGALEAIDAAIVVFERSLRAGWAGSHRRCADAKAKRADLLEALGRAEEAGRARTAADAHRDASESARPR